MKNNPKIRFAIMILLVAISVSTMFFGVISYETPDGVRTTYALQDIISGTRFQNEVLNKYTGSVELYLGPWALTVLCVLAVGAVLAALTGILIMSSQKPVRWPYIMTLFGVVGTAIPSLLIIAAVIVSVSWFPGTISCGLYPIVTPFAMLLCLMTVVHERKRVIRAKKAARNAPIVPAGDLI